MSLFINWDDLLLSLFSECCWRSHGANSKGKSDNSSSLIDFWMTDGEKSHRFRRSAISTWKNVAIATICLRYASMNAKQMELGTHNYVIRYVKNVT